MSSCSAAMPGALEGDPARPRRRGRRSATPVVGEVAGLDARAVADPLVVGLDRVLEPGVGHEPRRERQPTPAMVACLVTAGRRIDGVRGLSRRCGRRGLGRARRRPRVAPGTIRFISFVSTSPVPASTNGVGAGRRERLGAVLPPHGRDHLAPEQLAQLAQRRRRARRSRSRRSGTRASRNSSRAERRRGPARPPARISARVERPGDLEPHRPGLPLLGERLEPLDRRHAPARHRLRGGVLGSRRAARRRRAPRRRAPRRRRRRAPSSAVIVPGTGLAGALHRLPAHDHELERPRAAAATPAATRAANSPSECPATPTTSASPSASEHPERGDAAGQQRRLDERGGRRAPPWSWQPATTSRPIASDASSSTARPAGWPSTGPPCPADCEPCPGKTHRDRPWRREPTV